MVLNKKKVFQVYSIYQANSDKQNIFRYTSVVQVCFSNLPVVVVGVVVVGIVVVGIGVDVVVVPVVVIVAVILKYTCFC